MIIETAKIVIVPASSRANRALRRRKPGSVISFDVHFPGMKRWSREFGPVVKVDRLMRKTIQDEEAKESFC
ncbi:hypothetical protein [Tateyamaria sp.]|uniref:hypothetical protein n=1 Tax=Tateyamaria sp. TaxID=1929288 RepID=UPI003B223566